jgi:hypothetical protein
MPKTDLWSSDDVARWERALASYPSVVDRQEVEGLAALDAWVREELPASISGRTEPHVTHEELVRVTRWKMARGVWRGRNLALVKGNDPDEVEAVSRAALARIPDPRAPIAELSKLAGVGPATASAVAAAAAPEHYPFFDDLVARQVPALPDVAFTPAFYARYADALRARAARLGPPWTPVLVERALWAVSGGKAGVGG